jgi:Putative Flp pilus-assembly TadE/G-like
MMVQLLALWADTDGVILPYVTIMLVVIIGVSVLALDGARFLYLETELQNGADALALTAAAELDRTPTAITRALNAINKFGNSDPNVKVGDIKFLNALPLRDTDPILPAYLTTDPTEAAFVEVSVEPVAMQTILPASVFGGSNVLAAGAQAIAGFDQVVCNFTPIYVCNPFEVPGMTYAEATEALVKASDDPASPHRLIRLASTQTIVGERFRPGNFGYLAPATGFLPVDFCGPPSGHGLGQALAASRPPVCLRLSGVDLERGDDQTAMDGLNTRFDIYASSFQSCKDNYVADLNVRKGYVAPGNTNWCAAKPAAMNWPIPDANATPLPVDQNMIDNNPDNGALQADPNVAVGNGVWDCADYWNEAHYSGPGKNYPPPGCTAAATISRFSVYQYEMNYIADRSPGAEYGYPQCNPSGVKYRRVLNAAIINCGSTPDEMTNDARNVPVAGFGQFFLTVPAASGPTLYAEFMGLIKPTNALNHDMVQLYR